MCGLSRLLFPAAMVGLGVATMAGSTAGWLAAAAVAAVLYLVGRRRPAGACGIAPSAARPFAGLDRADEPRADEPRADEPRADEPRAEGELTRP